MADILFVAFVVILGALWRRWFGGWLDLDVPRVGKLAGAALLGILATLPAWLTWGPVVCLVVIACFTAYWAPGHDLQGWTLRRWLLRYGPVGVYWWLANRHPISWQWGRFIDGSNALAELAAGGTIYGCLALVAAGS